MKIWWIKELFENSFHGMALLELGMQYRPEAVDYPREMVLQRPNQPNQTLRPGTKIIEVFEEVGRELLILGEPGSGKTTMLLELTRDLIARAERDDNHPIPVVFNLSSWSDEQKPIADWLVDELR